MRQSDILYWRGITTWFTKFDAERALDLFFNSFEVFIGCVVCQSKNRSTVKEWALVLIPCLCAMLGKQVPLQIKDKLHAILEDRRFPSWNGTIEKMITEIDHFCSITEIHLTFQSGSEARRALLQKNFPVARKKGLSSWRGMVALIGSELFMKKLLVFDRIFWVMFCEIADCLRQVYAQEKQSISGWFCVFLLKVARFIEAPFLGAKYHAYYVEYLQRQKHRFRPIAYNVF